MNLPRYPKYKDSGVEWLGDVPAHWALKRLRFVATLNPSKSELTACDRSTTVSFLPMEAISDDGVLALDRTRQLEEVESGYTYFRDGDVVIAKITPCFENGKGAFVHGLTEGIGFGTTELIVVRPRADTVTGPFLNWLFRSPNFRRRGEAFMYGAGGQKRVPDDFVRNLLSALPPLEEQASIAEFLGVETAKIDMLIAEQEKLIALLDEKRQATISHAVTRGLNPDVPMKDSGVEWLGEVPVHWGVKPMGYFCKAISYGFTNPMPCMDDGPFMLTANDIGMGFVDYESARRTSYDAFRTLLTEKSRPKANDILITKDGTLGRVALFDGADACVNQSVGIVRTYSHVALPRYVALALCGRVYQDRMLFEAGGTTIKHIYISRLAKMPMAVPPLDEQSSIASYLQDQGAKWNAVLSAAQGGIALLKERRSALITAAVTGQIDVRNAVDLSPEQLEAVTA